jgi:hypothetical protein
VPLALGVRHGPHRVWWDRACHRQRRSVAGQLASRARAGCVE